MEGSCSDFTRRSLRTKRGGREEGRKGEVEREKERGGRERERRGRERERGERERGDNHCYGCVIVSSLT